MREPVSSTGNRLRHGSGAGALEGLGDLQPELHRLHSLQYKVQMGMGEDMDIARLSTFVMTLSKQVNDN